MCAAHRNRASLAPSGRVFADSVDVASCVVIGAIHKWQERERNEGKTRGKKKGKGKKKGCLLVFLLGVRLDVCIASQRRCCVTASAGH